MKFGIVVDHIPYMHDLESRASMYQRPKLPTTEGIQFIVMSFMFQLPTAKRHRRQTATKAFLPVTTARSEERRVGKECSW